ncbi:hypothetical protein BC936DRAFT_140135 [Jimgerdemannia flammicorona]|uniref:Uncharacterized protein n=1 Tax=Jimgerdemannia flammicorona TaxID=994334 RepID=A0A433DH99_9FUNG|nr:hypothetical protein BC936DRAFT_140135 [Jimgerdemannia flammicorona]
MEPQTPTGADEDQPRFLILLSSPPATAPGLPLSPPGSSQNSFSNAPPKSDEDSNRMSVDESGVLSGLGFPRGLGFADEAPPLASVFIVTQVAGYVPHHTSSETHSTATPTATHHGPARPTDGARATATRTVRDLTEANTSITQSQEWTKCISHTNHSPLLTQLSTLDCITLRTTHTGHNTELSPTDSHHPHSPFRPGERSRLLQSKRYHHRTSQHVPTLNSQPPHHRCAHRRPDR